MEKKYTINFTLNGKERTVETTAGTTMSTLLREILGNTGTKVGCDIGDCGACTIIMNGRAVKSCILPAMKADGADIVTIEGLGGKDGLHPLQKKFVEYAAVQCGYCTPGMILAAKAFLDENPNPTEEEARIAISGNICRCTGYVKPVLAILSAAEEMKGEVTNE
jgi:carbon-monoxide dehydrogenase small subunit